MPGRSAWEEGQTWQGMPPCSSHLEIDKSKLSCGLPSFVALQAIMRSVVDA